MFNEFDQQHQLDISDEDRILLSAYKPLTVDNFEEYQEEFFKNLVAQPPTPTDCKQKIGKYRFVYPGVVIINGAVNPNYQLTIKNPFAYPNMWPSISLDYEPLSIIERANKRGASPFSLLSLIEARRRIS